MALGHGVGAQQGVLKVAHSDTLGRLRPRSWHIYKFGLLLERFFQVALMWYYISSLVVVAYKMKLVYFYEALTPYDVIRFPVW